MKPSHQILLKPTSMQNVLKLAFLSLLLLIQVAVFAQDEELEAVDDAAGAISAILGGKGKGISKAKVVANTEQTLTVELHVSGFEEKSKISGMALNKIKKEMSEITSEAVMLPSGEGVVELKFQLKPGDGKNKNAFLESDFLTIVVSKADGLFADIDLGPGAVFGDTYLYKLNKKWRVSGSEAMVIEVKLVPLKSAGSIQQ